MSSYNAIYEQLESNLITSDAKERMTWAKQIVDTGIDLKALSIHFLNEEKKTALRFSWLLSDIGVVSKESLFAVLPYLFEQRDATSISEFPYQFVKYWRICGVPDKNKGAAIDLMFQWLMEPKQSTHIKTICLTVLYDLTQEYPELKNELRLCIEEQKATSVSFKKTADKILANI